MISIGIAVRIKISPLPYAVAAARPAIDRPTVAAGADDAMPITVSCATPIASGSSLATGRGIDSTPDAVCSHICLPLLAEYPTNGQSQKFVSGIRSAILLVLCGLRGPPGPIIRPFGQWCTPNGYATRAATAAATSAGSSAQVASPTDSSTRWTARS